MANKLHSFIAISRDKSKHYILKVVQAILFLLDAALSLQIKNIEVCTFLLGNSTPDIAVK